MACVPSFEVPVLQAGWQASCLRRQPQPSTWIDSFFWDKGVFSNFKDRAWKLWSSRFTEIVKSQFYWNCKVPVLRAGLQAACLHRQPGTTWEDVVYILWKTASWDACRVGVTENLVKWASMSDIIWDKQTDTARGTGTYVVRPLFILPGVKSPEHGFVSSGIT